MIFQELIVMIFEFVGFILSIVFGWFPNVSLDTNWVVYARKILEWAEYFFPVHILYEQFAIIVAVLTFYLLFKLVRFILRR